MILKPEGVYTQPKPSKPTLVPRPWREDMRFTPRQTQCLHHILLGMSNKQIAPIMGISENTVKQYVQALCIAYSVRTRYELMAKHYLTVISELEGRIYNARADHSEAGRTTELDRAVRQDHVSHSVEQGPGGIRVEAPERT